MKKILFLCFLLGLWACESQQLESSNDLPPASGEGGEILLFMDSVTWKGKLGDEIRTIFQESQAGILQDEKIFKLRWIEPTKLNKFLKLHYNLIFVTTFDLQTSGTKKLKEFFPKEGIDQITKNTNLYMLQKQNIYAKGQQILHLFGKNQESLLENLKVNRKKLREIFNKIEEERIKKRIILARQSNLEQQIQDELQIKMFVPAGYQIALQNKTKEESFIWLRFAEAVLDKNVMVCQKTYTSEEQFRPENVMAWRDSLMQKYVYGDPKNPESYVITERLEPPVFDTLRVNNQYVIEMRGLWKTNNISMGGSFVAYIFAKNDKIYYTEGLLYAPDLPKREHLRELAVTLKQIP